MTKPLPRMICTVAVLAAAMTHLAHGQVIKSPSPIDPRVATLLGYDYEVYELVPGCNTYEIGDIVTLYYEGVPPQTTTVGGTGPDAGTKVRRLPQR